ncbi:hypothetical protein VTK73DRAFT_6706 [Phialemonium thermophilum]|uniref:Uncharacterized protein n=1 Tax=Phialemonium thermophilum TaxID=223376 RepID=A0ABR3XV59_9PEZI
MPKLRHATPEPLGATEIRDTSHAALTPGKRRVANLYDAVAGRVTSTYTLERLSRPRTRHGGTDRDVLPLSSSSLPPPSNQNKLGAVPLTPEEVLFRRSGAPQRFAEKDVYFANDDLPDGGRGILPDSDLLKSLHVYASHFYEALGRRCGRDAYVGSKLVDERSMDETALLAMGVLLEEAARDVLGRRAGHLVFTAGLDDHLSSYPGENTTGGISGENPQREGTVASPLNAKDEIRNRSYPKRRKTTQTTAEDEG